jgi:sterol desaturase/sphingolipid hydroxylase (fatty acid hydroxylase superfamily)
LANYLNWLYGLIVFGAILGRYFLIAGSAYWLFYRVLNPVLAARRLRLKPPLGWAIRADIQLATLSAIIFAISAMVVILSYERGWTRLYGNLEAYGFWYLGLSYIAVLVMQDTYFYFVHRLLHRPRLFRWMHQGHHRSGDPTPWTSFAFDPAEAVLQTLFLLGVIFVVPLHFATLVAALITMTGWTVLNHLGFELFPRSFPHHWLGKWLIGPTHHALHHRKYRVHYGLYFTFWDRLLGTHDPSYEQEFDASLRPQASFTNLDIHPSLHQP